MKATKFLTLCFIIIASLLTVNAEEGMWMPHQMKDLDLKALGLKMNPEDLYKEDGTGLMSAIVSFGGGTGEFVSGQGLILTNHHVAFGALQRAATPEKDYLTRGFLAETKEDEIPAQGYFADVLLGYEEVTAQVHSVLKPGMTYKEKYYALDDIIKKIISNEENKGKDRRARVASMYSGNKYYLFRFKRIKDIRVVYAPPLDLGLFGGDIDNWMWPRHTCDFTFMRAYVSKDSMGVDYSPDNVPYQPKAFLKISLEGFKEGDFSFVMGYPERTFRHYTLAELKQSIAFMQQNITLRKDLINFLENAGKDRREVQIKYASTLQGLNNYLKNFQGKLEGIEKINLLGKKDSEQKKFLEWIMQTPQRKNKYGDSIKNIHNFIEKQSAFQPKTQLFDELTSPFFGSMLLSQAYTIQRASLEQQKPDMEREPEFQERNLPYIKQRIKLAERRYDLSVDRALLKHQLKGLFSLPSEQIPNALKDIVSSQSEEKLESYVDKLYDTTTLADPEKRLQYIALAPEELEKLNDPLLDLAAALEKERKELREKERILGQERQDLKKIYLEALLEQKKARLAPDANGTIRFTSGLIEGYKPRDAVYYFPQTTIGGVIEKDTGEFPFRVPEKLKELYREKNFGRYIDKSLNDVPACFLNSTTITGGNSGSPTLNANGEQIGIIFDMTYEDVTGDYYIIPELQRTISVDIRYVLFITEKFSGATHIIKELGI